MPLYEIMCITSVAATHKHVLNTLKKVHTAVTDRGGVVRGIEHLGVRPLAYRMRSHMKWNSVGRYVRFFLQSSPQALKEVEHRLKIDEEVVRFMTLKRELAPKRPPQKLSWRNDSVFPAAEVAFHKKYSHLDYFAARELLRRGTLTAEQIAAHDFSAVKEHAPSKGTATAATAAPAPIANVTLTATTAPASTAAVSTAATTN